MSPDRVTDHVTTEYFVESLELSWTRRGTCPSSKSPKGEDQKTKEGWNTVEVKGT